MIDPKELRIGNWVTFEQYPESVTQVGPQLLSCNRGIWDEPDIYIPIPLTPEWLERLGFDKDTGEKESQPFYDVFVWVYGSWRIKFDNTVYIGPEIKYVHQLQNLWKALTGEEL